MLGCEGKISKTNKVKGASMVIRKCKDGESQIDWIKSLAIIGVFGGIILWCVQVATNADKKAETALTKIDMVAQNQERMEAKLDRLIEQR